MDVTREQSTTTTTLLGAAEKSASELKALREVIQKIKQDLDKQKSQIYKAQQQVKATESAFRRHWYP